MLMVYQSFNDGDRFKVASQRGVFIFRGWNADGSVRCFGGTQGRERCRSFPVSAGLKPLSDKALRRVVDSPD
jgi:hypothetical protein